MNRHDCADDMDDAAVSYSQDGCAIFSWPSRRFPISSQLKTLPSRRSYRATEPCEFTMDPRIKMIMPVGINGQPANVLVDTGSNEIILDTNAAATFGISPSPRGVCGMLDSQKSMASCCLLLLCKASLQEV